MAKGKLGMLYDIDSKAAAMIIENKVNNVAQLAGLLKLCGTIDGNKLTDKEAVFDAIDLLKKSREMVNQDQDA